MIDLNDYEVKKFMANYESTLPDRIIKTLYLAVEYNFPNIKNLHIKYDDKEISVTFNEGEYSKIEVEKKIKEIMSYKIKGS